MTQDFPAQNIDALATGAWILGTGGGGNPYMGQLNLQRLYAQGHSCRVLQPEDLADDDMVAVVSKMGAPLVSQERLVDPAHLARAVTLMDAEELGGAVMAQLTDLFEEDIRRASSQFAAAIG